MHLRKMLAIAAGVTMLAQPVAAQTPTDFLDAKDKMVPKTVSDQTGMGEGRAWWWAMGECGAWHRKVRAWAKNGGELVDAPDDKMMTFVLPMIDRLVADRGMKFDEAMRYSRNAMDVSMVPRVSMLAVPGTADAWDKNCDALLVAYNKQKF